MTRPRTLFVVIVLLECTAIALVGMRIITQRANRLTAAIVPIAKEGISFPTGSDLAHFYEPKPGTPDTGNSEPAWLPYRPVYTINQDALHERFDYVPQKPEHTYRIVTLGDSFTYGLFVHTEENWTERLEDLLKTACASPPKFEVVNLGMQGYDLRYSTERYRLRGVKYDPDLIVWLVNDNDLNDINDLSLPKTHNYIAKLGGQRIEPWEFDLWGAVHRDIIAEVGLTALETYQQETLELFRALYGGPLLLYAPTDFPAAGNVPSGYVDSRMLLDGFAASRPHTFIYAHQLLTDALKYPDSHPTADGHAAIADDVLRYLMEHRLVPCT